MSLHPTLVELLELTKSKQTPSFHQGSPAQARALLAASAAALGGGPEVHQIRDISIATRAGELPGRLYRSGPREAGLIVYLHGGGWVLGSIAEFDALCRQICHQSQCAVLYVDYRLAPEHPFPMGLNDALDATVWAWQRRAELAGDIVPLALAGDSAGGNLAAIVVNELKEQIAFAIQALVYPVTDCSFDTDSYLAFESGYFLQRQDMQWFFNHYAPAAEWSSARITPLNNSHWRGTPTTWIGVADHDVLRDDGIRYAKRLQENGVNVTLTVYPGMTHGFIRMANLIDVARQAVTDLSTAIHGACVAAKRESSTQ